MRAKGQMHIRKCVGGRRPSRYAPCGRHARETIFQYLQSKSPGPSSNIFPILAGIGSNTQYQSLERSKTILCVSLTVTCARRAASRANVKKNRVPYGKIEILEPLRLSMASMYFYSPRSQLFNGVLIIEKDDRGAEFEIFLFWNPMTQSRS